ncbi:MAG: Ribose transport system permease protein RbsC [Spirochaetes bacterium ADurb.Bin110]|nr:MAG: Ribose transport system permease protein RbsC [Spirochaetes bacterium ADurb.Bin110]
MNNSNDIGGVKGSIPNDYQFITKEKTKSFDIKDILRRYGLLLSFFVLSLGISLVTQNFLSATNLLNILRQSAIVGIMAIGTTFVIIGGGFDISVGSTLALSAALALGLQGSMHWTLAALIAILVGLLIGFINGFLAAKIHIVPMIATLGTSTIIRGLVYLYTGGYPINGQQIEFEIIGSGYLWGIPIPVIIMVLLALLFQFILSKTQLGRYCCAVGGNKEASKLAGVAVDYYHIMTFVIGGLMAAISGVVYASRLSSATPLAGQNYDMDAIAAVVIGGTSVSGGEGTVLGSIIGVLLLTVITNAFNLLGVPVFIQYVIKGLIILVVVGIDSYTRKRE